MRARFSMFSAAFLLLGATWSPALCESAFTVHKEPIDAQLAFWNMTIQSRVDSLTINKITVNRTCQGGGGVMYPMQLAFGQTAWLGTYFCDPMEVVVSTDQGELSAGWDTGEKDLIARKVNIPDFMPPPGGNWKVFLYNQGSVISIRNVIVNRDKCRYAGRIPMPENEGKGTVLLYGDRYAILTGECNPLEVIVETSDGTKAFTFPN